MYIFTNNLKNILKLICPISINSILEIRCVRFYVEVINRISNNEGRNEIKGKVISVDVTSSSSIVFNCLGKIIEGGSEVVLNAVKPKVASTWCATKTETTKESENKGNQAVDKKEKLSKKVVGTVTFAANKKIKVDNFYSYIENDSNPVQFRPIKGDIVIIQLDHSKYKNEIVNISPLRSINFDGIITSFNGNTGFVNDKIFFNSSISKNNSLELGSKVYGVAIESVQENRYNYRVLKLFIKEETDSTKEINNENQLIDTNSQKIKSNIYGKLKLYKIPIELENNIINKVNLTNIYPILTESINPQNYIDKMKLLIFLEEIHTKEEMKQFRLVNVRLIHRFGAFELQVPGLSEGQLYLTIGDKVNIVVNGDEKYYRVGTIEDIKSDRIFVKTDQEFQSKYSNEECTVSFNHSRLPFRRMHLGVDVASEFMNYGIVFPDNISIKPSQFPLISSIVSNDNPSQSHPISTITLKQELLDLSKVKYFNQSLNQEQKLAILRIIQGLSRPLPYVLFGPPGTGKTITLIEAILQIYKNMPSSRILICAPSNGAVDLLCLKLHETGLIQTGEMVRMFSKHKLDLIEMPDYQNIPEEILSYSKSTDKVQSILLHRIILTTCNSSETLYREYRKPGHITHVFIDEAGQACEPDVMIPMGLITPDNGQILLTGDPMQLGPVIRSVNAKQLEKSYLERLLYSCKIYQSGYNSENKFNPLLVTQLIHNYRSHPALLKLSSDLFYNGTLIGSAKKLRFLNWKWLPNPKIPFIFHDVHGKELRGNNVSSIYNVEEAQNVVAWIKRLIVDFGDNGNLKCSNINVITPYRAQVDCINKLLLNNLQCNDIDQLKVASVEEFQGQENEVIIVSTVRSSMGMKDNNFQSRLKFLSNSKRFNVSITRAKSLLIVIGDPILLKHEQCWNKLIKYALLNNAFI